MDLQELITRSGKNAVDRGFRDSRRTFAEDVVLIHAELSEAIEEYRNGEPTHVIRTSDEGKPEGIPIELADVLIRLCESCSWHGIPLVEATEIKEEYNATRPYRHGGKVI